MRMAQQAIRRAEAWLRPRLAASSTLTMRRACSLSGQPPQVQMRLSADRTCPLPCRSSASRSKASSSAQDALLTDTWVVPSKPRKVCFLPCTPDSYLFNVPSASFLFAEPFPCLCTVKEEDVSGPGEGGDEFEDAAEDLTQRSASMSSSRSEVFQDAEGPSELAEVQSRIAMHRITRSVINPRVSCLGALYIDCDTAA